MVATLRAALPSNDVYTKRDFMKRAVMYWTVETGIGMAFFLTAILAILIGGAIAGQTIYAGTMEHLRDYGTLKAMGARNRDINVIILSQAAISASLGFGIGMGITLLAQGAIDAAGVPIYLPPSLNWRRLCDRRVDVLGRRLVLGAESQDPRSRHGL